MIHNKFTQNQTNEEDPSKFLNRIIFKKFKILNLISDGTFGKIYLATNNKNEKFVVKMEKADSMIKLLEQAGYFQHSLEYGVPKLIALGKIKNYFVSIEQYLGKSLYDLVIYHRDKLTIQDKCLISMQLIERIEYLHSKKLIHRDIKPQNFLFGLDDPNVIYLTEFRFCAKYRSSKTGKHVKHDFRGTFTGGLLYSSANAQRGMQQSRKDDLESLGYVILFVFKGKLPWDLENLENLDLMNLNQKEIYLKTYRMKKFIPTEKLCKDCPQELEEYFKYIRSLKFEEEPNYKKLKNLFIDIIKKERAPFNNIEQLGFSWIEQGRNKSKPKINGRAFSKNKLFDKILKNFENKRNENKTLRNYNNISNSGKLDDLVNIMNKSAETENNYKINSPMINNKQNNCKLQKKVNANVPIINDYINPGNNIKKNIMDMQKVKNVNEYKMNNYLTNIRFTTNNNHEIINKYPEQMNMNQTERNYAMTNNNMKINHYYKINNNNNFVNNRKRINNNNHYQNIPKMKINLNLSARTMRDNLIYLNNNIKPNMMQNFRTNQNQQNNNIINRQLTLNNKNNVNLSSVNFYNKLKNNNLDKLKNNKMQMIMNNNQGNKKNIYQQKVNKMNKSINLKNHTNNYLLNRYQTYSNQNENNINSNTFNN